MQVFTAAILLFLLLCPGWPENDPVQRQVQELRKTHGLWVNGVSPNLELGSKPKDGELLSALSRAYRKKYQLIRAQDVVVDAGQSTHRALLVEDGDGQWVILARFEGGHWWSRPYRVLP